MNSTITKTKTLNQNALKRFMSNALFVVGMGFLMFYAYGKLSWFEGWLFISLYGVYSMIGGIVLSIKNPDLVNRRGKKHENIEKWDKAFIIISSRILLLTPAIAALDTVRYGISLLPDIFVVIGAILLTLGNFLFTYSAMTNSHFEYHVIVNKESGHKVVDTGVYGFLRHPGYLGLILSTIAIPMILKSALAFVPAVIFIIMVCMRIVKEEQVLERDLEGYVYYKRNVRYRIIPGIW